MIFTKSGKILGQFLIVLFILFIYINNTFGYLDNLDSYKNLGPNIIKVTETEYSNFKENEKYKLSREYKELNNLVKVDNMFDIASQELEKKIALKKNKIINKLRVKEPIKTGKDDIDNEIAKLELKGRYLLLEMPGQLLSISDNNYIYIYKHKIIGNVDVIKKVQSIFNKYKNKDNNINNKEGYKKELISLLQSYKIHFLEIKGYGVKGNIFIGKNFNKKSKQQSVFFISKGFTTPYLEENYEINNKGKVYLWKYLTEDDIYYNYNIRENQRNGSEIFINIPLFNDTIYMGKVADNNKILKNGVLGGKLDIFIYKINKNPYEYIIFIVFILLGILLGLYLTNNFVNNYRNNFKRIPEEL